MSLILEALKKSEAERQRGQAPGLFVEQAPLARRREGAPAWAYALSAALLVLLALFGWREWSRSQSVDAATASTAGAADAPVYGSTEPAGPEPAPTLPAADRTEPAGPLPATGQPAPVASAPARPAPAPEPARRAPAASDGAPGSRALARAEAAPAPATPRSDGPGETTTTPTPALPRLADLSPAERSGLPPLRITMHVYSDEPASRFVILDGRRLGEGALAADGIVLREIRRDGVVLDARGRALLLPRP